MSTNHTSPHDLSFGVFDHMDRGRLPLADQYEQEEISSTGYNLSYLLMAVLVWVMLLAVSATGVAMWLSRRPA